ncbi:MAG: endonuclease domain-containing protein [Sphingomicrobium sp.]
MKHHPPTGAVGRARDLRKKMTDAERAMWRLLKLSFADYHFRKQVPIRHYIADFVNHRAKLVIEVDGGQHSPEVDAERTRIIEAEGYRVLRFWNNDVLRNPDGVWALIEGALRERHPTPTPPHQGEGQ